MTDTDNSWIQTFTGKAFYPLEPFRSEIDIEDIAHALSNLCRYGGHSNEFYSVAQHSVLVSRNVSEENALWGLLHDATEAYLIDLVRPVKRRMPVYQKFEINLAYHIALHFGLPANIPDEVHRVDNAILADEMPVLIGKPAAPWNLPEPPLGIKIDPWGPKFAKQVFLNEYEKLVKRSKSL
ncbi:phosphohydrolase [uncultured Roseibium sp.]|uniref:phosphohydrolase n=1 Tax=uncultured Roseibium sp. TaxID=1936171 RepID=UPI002608BCFF|nr:phosphohydrolase [uncultured Roseibium sp.]